MGDKTAIQWTMSADGTPGSTWNPTRGCTRVSQGCVNCYAESMAARFSDPGAPYHGFAERTKNGGRWTGKLALVESALDQPLRWRKPRKIFVNSMSDLFHESLPDEAIDRVFAVATMADLHTFQILTKRAKRMRRYMSDPNTIERIWHVIRNLAPDYPDAFWDWALQHRGIQQQHVANIQLMRAGEAKMDVVPVDELFPFPPPHIWLGVSAEDQERWDERVEQLGATPAAVRFVSVEPMLGPIDTGNAFDPPPDGSTFQPVDWVICGGESGTDARPMHPTWARSLRDQCAAADVPFFFKQWGAWHADALLYTDMQGRNPPPNMKVGKKAAGRLLDGREHNSFPVTP